MRTGPAAERFNAGNTAPTGLKANGMRNGRADCCKAELIMLPPALGRHWQPQGGTPKRGPHLQKPVPARFATIWWV